MSEPRRVWSVSDGAYSDYTVEALFTKKEDAEATAASMNTSSRWRQSYVEEFLLYDEPVEKIVWWKGTAHLRTDGRYWRSTTPTIDRQVDWPWRLTMLVSERPRKKMIAAPMYDGEAVKLVVEGHDRAAVVKVMSDSIAQWIVETNSELKVPDFGEVQDEG